jgi:hypothetical protein
MRRLIYVWRVMTDRGGSRYEEWGAFSTRAQADRVARHLRRLGHRVRVEKDGDTGKGTQSAAQTG